MYCADWEFVGYLIKSIKPTSIKVYVHKYEPIASYYNNKNGYYYILYDKLDRFVVQGRLKFDLICYMSAHRMLSHFGMTKKYDINKVFGFTQLMNNFSLRAPLRDLFYNSPVDITKQFHLLKNDTIMAVLDKYMDTYSNLFPRGLDYNTMLRSAIQSYLLSVVGVLKGKKQMEIVLNDPMVKNLIHTLYPELLDHYVNLKNKEDKKKVRELVHAEESLYLYLL